MSAHPPMSKELSGSHCVIFQLHQPEFHHLERTILQHLSAWKLPGSFPRWLLGGSPWDGLWKVTLILGQPAFCPPSTLACTHSYVYHNILLFSNIHSWWDICPHTLQCQRHCRGCRVLFAYGLEFNQEAKELLAILISFEHPLCIWHKAAHPATCHACKGHRKHCLPQPDVSVLSGSTECFRHRLNATARFCTLWSRSCFLSKMALSATVQRFVVHLMLVKDARLCCLHPRRLDPVTWAVFAFDR